MISVCSGQSMTFSTSRSPCAFLEYKQFGILTDPIAVKLVDRLTGVMVSYGIERERIMVTCNELAKRRWAIGGKL